jgi:tol-pal system protein YbgF
VAPPPSVLPEGGPKEQYDYSIGLLRQNRFDEAEAALKAFLDRHGGHALAGNARYWLGETYYVRADYMNAAATFLESYRKEPKGSKAPDSLLKLGMSLINLEKPKEACSTLAKLDKEYPDAPDNVRAVAARERARAKCK